MLAELPRARRPLAGADRASRWTLGIGINTGPALVGNTGSRRKFKYGPLGHTVNLASRVEGATKQLGVPVLITGGNTERLDLPDALATSRLCRARLAGIDDAVDLYQLEPSDSCPRWRECRDGYEEALRLYEAGQLPAACRVLYRLVSERGDEDYDIPSLDLIARAIQYVRSPSEPFDPVLKFREK